MKEIATGSSSVGRSTQCPRPFARSAVITDLAYCILRPCSCFGAVWHVDSSSPPHYDNVSEKIGRGGTRYVELDDEPQDALGHGTAFDAESCAMCANGPEKAPCTGASSGALLSAKSMALTISPGALR